jgi:hypothetical protein
VRKTVLAIKHFQAGNPAHKCNYNAFVASIIFQR